MAKYIVEYWVERTDNAYRDKREKVDELPEEGDSVTVNGKPHVVTHVLEHAEGYHEVYAMPRGLYEEQNSERLLLGKIILAFLMGIAVQLLMVCDYLQEKYNSAKETIAGFFEDEKNGDNE
jgi:hypothetical protein